MSVSFTARMTVERTSITPENTFCAARIISTLALGILSFQSPLLFTLGLTSFTLFNVLAFNHAVKVGNISSKGLRLWMVTACLVTSAALGGMCIAWALPTLGAMLTAFKTWQIGTALIQLSWSTGLIGFGLPLANAFYKRGFELLQNGSWQEMQLYLARPVELRNKVDNFIKKCAFYALVLFPHDMQEIIPEITPSLSSLPYFFSRQSDQKKYIRDMFSIYKELPADYTEEKQDIWTDIITNFKELSDELQLALLQELLLLCQDKREDLILNLTEKNKLNLVEIIKKIDQDVKVTLPNIYTALKRMEEELHAGASASTLAKEMSQYQAVINTLLSDVKAFGPEHLRLITPLQNALIMGPVTQEIQTQIAREQAGKEVFDGEDPTYNYFITRYGREFFDAVLRVTDTADFNELDAKLENHGIETLGKFVETLLKGNKARLENKEKVLQEIEDFFSIRNRVYTVLSGESVSCKASHLTKTVAKIIFRATMIFTAVAPIVAQPHLALYGVFSYGIYRATPPLRNLVDSFLHSYRLGYAIPLYIATRRPFISLLYPNPPQEVQTFENADFYGKMRLFATEFFYGGFLTRVTIGLTGIRIGGFIQGINLSNETFHLLRHTWRQRPLV